ncbi:unnamed protein product [Cuscuta epithymum]|uniref:Uncharacterized protein n=1 Tax=Cuscuta epithymum TaxID=186058 RepID=A0AAV0FBG1_9ASTE|nr:unnamed protein product [Cuscuta epithymum]
MRAVLAKINEGSNYLTSGIVFSCMDIFTIFFSKFSIIRSMQCVAHYVQYNFFLICINNSSTFLVCGIISHNVSNLCRLNPICTQSRSSSGPTTASDILAILVNNMLFMNNFHLIIYHIKHCQQI